MLIQLVGIEEDRLCKPTQPFPASRISLERGQDLYYLVIAISFSMSIYHGLTFVSFVYFCATWSYNEFGLSANLLAKNPIGAIGYMCYCWGTTYIIGKSNSPVYATDIDLTLLVRTRSSQTSKQYIDDRYIG